MKTIIYLIQVVLVQTPGHNGNMDIQTNRLILRGSSFIVQKINGSTQTPYDYQPSHYLPETGRKVVNISNNLEKTFQHVKTFEYDLTDYKDKT